MRLILLLFLSSNVFAQEYFGIKFLDNYQDTSIVPGPEAVRYSDVFGFYYKGDKYAVLGSNLGSHYFQVQEERLIPIDFELGKFFGPTVQHRDFKIYKNFLYAVCDEGNSSLQIFDLKYLPDSVSKVYDNNSLFTVSHNIFIDTINAKLYACGPDNISLKIYDLDDPISPKMLFDMAPQIDYVHDCFIRNDTAFLNCGFDGLQVYAFNEETPNQIGLLNFYPEKGYNHSGWWSDEGNSYCFIDETIGTKIKYCNLSSGINNLSVSELFGTKNAENFVPHNVCIKNGFAFVAYYNEGLRVFDLESKPIKEIAYYDTYSENSDYKLNGAWGVHVFSAEGLILISDRQHGLFLLKMPLNNLRNNSITNGTPFIDQNSLIIFNTKEQVNYKFTIITINGKVMYQSEDFSNWINIPLSLESGAYIYHVSNNNKDVIEAGKFIIQ